MISLKLNKKSLVIVTVAAGLLGAGILLGYANYPRIANGWDPGGAKTAQEIARGESPGEHGPGGEQGVRGESGGSGSEEASGAILAPNDTFDAVRSGAWPNWEGRCRRCSCATTPSSRTTTGPPAAFPC